MAKPWRDAKPKHADRNFLQGRREVSEPQLEFTLERVRLPAFPSALFLRPSDAPADPEIGPPASCQ
jgi:hypothetical protein